MKPPYQIPSVSDIKAGEKRSGLKAVSTFSGAGGASLGLAWSGIEVMWASEFIDAAADVYELNNPGIQVDRRDIRQVTGSEILDAVGLGVGELDVFEGSPPCASFSMSGKRQEGWGEVRSYSETKQRVDDLFFEFIRLVDETRPKTFIAENVDGMTIGVAKGYLKEIVHRMRNIGYRVGVWRLDCSRLGVPQRRVRVVIHGVRGDLSAALVAPKPFDYVYTWDDATKRPMPVSDDPLSPWSADSKLARVMSRAKPGESGQAVVGSGFFSHYRLAPGEPSPTILQTNNWVLPPYENRRITLGEVRRLCGFPDDFALTGNFSQRWERLGRAVAPPMYKAVGESIVEALKGTS